MTFDEVFRKAGLFAAKNSPTLLSAVAVAGTVTTAYLTGKASFRAAQIIDDMETDYIKDTGYQPSPTYWGFREKTAATWPLFVPAVGTAAVTITAIIVSNRIGVRRATAVASALAISEKVFVEYQNKVVEQMGERKEGALRDELAQDRVRANPPSSEIVIVSGKVLCYDEYSGRYFESSVEDVKAAQNAVNHQINGSMYASLNDFYDRIGLSRTKAGDAVGWNSDHQLELTFAAVLTEENKPVISVDIHAAPVHNFWKQG